MLSSRTALCVPRSAILVCLALVAPLAIAGELSNVEVSFGRGLNTAQPGNRVNHAVLPSKITVKTGGVVDFGIAGFHDIIIFKPGFVLQDLIDAGGGDFPVDPVFPFVLPSDPLAPLPPELAFLTESIYYRGINPAGGPPQTPPTGVVSNAMNRSEPVAFLAPGTYLVICNVRPHLVDGMYAYVKVLPP